MLILPPGHAAQVGAGRTFSAREKWILSSVGALVVALVAAVVISISVAGHSTGNGCIDVTVPYSIGGQEFYKCGAAARGMCQSVGTTFTGQAGDAIATECRKVKLPVG